MTFTEWDSNFRHTHVFRLLFRSAKLVVVNFQTTYTSRPLPPQYMLCSLQPTNFVSFRRRCQRFISITYIKLSGFTTLRRRESELSCLCVPLVLQVYWSFGLHGWLVHSLIHQPWLGRPPKKLHTSSNQHEIRFSGTVTSETTFE